MAAAAGSGRFQKRLKKSWTPTEVWRRWQLSVMLPVRGHGASASAAVKVVVVIIVCNYKEESL